MKQTEIGLIPDDWEVKEIKDFADVTTGDKNTQDAEENGKYPFYVRSPIVERINKFSYDTEGVITAGDGVGTGKVFHYAKGKFGLHQRAYLIYNFKNTDPKYFYYNFSKNFYERVHSMTAKSSVDSVRREMITKMQIPIPPTLAEQQRIAKTLSDVDALISTTEKLIQKKKNIKQGTMQNLLTGKKRLPDFGDKQTDLFVPNGTHTKEVKDVSPEQIRLLAKMKQTELGEIPEDWEVKSLGEICVINPASYNIIPDEFFYVDLESVSSGKLEKKQKIHRRNAPSRAQRQFEKNDILYQTVRPYQRNNLFVNFDSKNYIASTGYAIIRSNNNVDSHYIYQIIHLNNFVNIILDNCTGTSYPAINPKFLKTIPVIIPKKEEQTAIANVLSSMDKEIETLNTKLEKYRNLKTAMMQQLLTGKIRLVK